jgi:trehalose-6-phosphate synthase
MNKVLFDLNNQNFEAVYNDYIRSITEPLQHPQYKNNKITIVTDQIWSNFN